MLGKQKIAILHILLIMLQIIDLIHAQRPFFAGSRPAGGLSQKDKYNQPELAAGITPTTQATEFANRFGSNSNGNGVEANQLPQRPPVPGGAPIVYPESKYEPLPTKPASTEGIQNRFGGSDDADINRNTVPSALPLDALGDKELVQQLSRLPVDKQPFWFINYQAIEAQRRQSVNNAGPPTPNRAFFTG